MIFVFDFFEQSKLPKYTEKVTMVMRQLNNRLFDSPEDLELIADILKKHLDECRPKGNTSYIDFYEAATQKSGGLFLRLKSDDGHGSDAARLRYVQVEGAVLFDEDKGCFVSYDVPDIHMDKKSIMRKEANNE